MTSIRENNKNTQLGIINDLITKKTHLIANHIGNLSLEEAKKIIENEYINVKSKLNQINAEIDITNDDIKKKKNIIKNLQLEKDALLNKEQQTLNNELNRIETKTQQNMSILNNTLDDYNNTLHNLLNKKRELESEIYSWEDYIKTFKYNRAQLRKMHINQINQEHENHKKKLRVKGELQYQIYQLERHKIDLEVELESYNTSRYNINQDYITWKNDITITKRTILSLQKEISEYCDSISNDLNSNYPLNDILNVWDTLYIDKMVNLLKVMLNNNEANDNYCINNSNSNSDDNNINSNDGTKHIILNKLNRVSQLILIYQNLNDDFRKDNESRYKQLDIKKHKTVKQISKLTKIINKFTIELEKTDIFKKTQINVGDLTENEDYYNETKQKILLNKKSLETINEDINTYKTKIVNTEKELDKLKLNNLTDDLIKDKKRCMLRWDKINVRCKEKYDTQCENISNDINLLFKNISSMKKELMLTETYWADINKNPGIILQYYHNNITNTTNTTNITNTANITNITNPTNIDGSNTDKIKSIKNDIMDIINLKRTITRIQANR